MNLRQIQMMNIGVILILMMIFSASAEATKPCPLSVCVSKDGAFDSRSCLINADWVSVGTVKRLHAEVLGHPVNQIRYEFDFVVDTLEKGKLPEYKLRFITGWCSNPVLGPLTEGDRIRLYGRKDRETVTEAGQFIGYEVLK